MTELTIRPEEIRAALDEFISSYEPTGASAEAVGQITETGDGIARVEGLPSAMANELLQFEDGTLGLALNLDVGDIGDGFLGRVVDPLGNPIDGLGPVESDARRALELQAPTVVQRQPVKEPLQTGIKAIDAMTPIGRGQRQLIIGDRQTGKTAVAI